MRTNCEAPFMTTLFSELPVFFSTNNTTSLPPTLAVYLMVNALHQHGLTPQVPNSLRKSYTTRRALVPFRIPPRRRAPRMRAIVPLSCPFGEGPLTYP